MNSKIIPHSGIDKDVLLETMIKNKSKDLNWQQGRAFCLVYHPGEKYKQLIQAAYNMYFTENALNPMVFPSLRKMENEVVSMVANLMNGGKHVRGSFTSGGTESILMAIKTSIAYSKENSPRIKYPEMILPETAHPTFAKAIDYFGIKGVYVPVDKNFVAVPEKIEEAITANTILLVASAPSYPHGTMDPVPEIGRIAQKHQLLFHVDACIGGFMLPFLKPITNQKYVYDFNVPGVSSISIDLHKYGYAAKGASVVLYKNANLRKHQFTVYTNWPGGVYGSSTVTGSRPGGTIAAAWATLMGIGMNGYNDLAQKAWNATKKFKAFIQQSEDLEIMGHPCMTLVAFNSNTIDIFELADELSLKGWHFDRLCDPPGIHLTISQIHDQYIDSFIRDIKLSLEIVKDQHTKKAINQIRSEVIKRLVKVLPQGLIAKIQGAFSGNAAKSDRIAPIYGMLGALKGTEDIDEIVRNLLDKLNTLEDEN